MESARLTCSKLWIFGKVRGEVFVVIQLLDRILGCYNVYSTVMEVYTIV